MTNEEAIKYLQQIYPQGGHCWLDFQRMEAIGMAIKALGGEIKQVGEAARKALQVEEPQERTVYRDKCKHHGMEDICYYYSGYRGWGHTTIACTDTQKCPRMKRYDKLHSRKEEGDGSNV